MMECIYREQRGKPVYLSRRPRDGRITNLSTRFLNGFQFLKKTFIFGRHVQEQSRVV